MPQRLRIPALAALLLLGACTTMPSGPGMLVLPGTGKSFEQFRGDDALCRQYAHGQVGGTTPEQAQSESGVRSAAVGTAVGAVAGAAIDGSRGAAVGAGTGLLVGSLAGTGAADASAHGLQQRYDHAYAQCMYAKGHRIPVSGRYVPDTGRGYPPPPPGYLPR
ncbi:MAG: hypothetical protein HYZ19_00015 [Rhodocyclales bacterium]|nr:hypothetical protein [Rhodocyclales bacterium]